MPVCHMFPTTCTPRTRQDFALSWSWEQCGHMWHTHHMGCLLEGRTECVLSHNPSVLCQKLLKQSIWISKKHESAMSAEAVKNSCRQGSGYTMAIV